MKYLKRFNEGRKFSDKLFRLCTKIFLTVKYVYKNIFSRASVVGKADAVVSMTSYGQRAHSVFLTLESIASGSIRPRRLILWLDEESLHLNPPKALKRLQRRGLEIIACQNFGPHKKYFPYVTSVDEPHKYPLVTADDDMFYPRNWLESLEAVFSDTEGEYIIGQRVRTISVTNENSNDASKLGKYSDWILCQTTQPSFANLSTGTGGVMYPTSILNELRRLGDSFMKICPKTDDLWLHRTAVALDLQTRQVTAEPADYIMLFKSQKDALFRTNLLDDGNDRAVERIYDSKSIDKIIASNANSEPEQ